MEQSDIQSSIDKAGAEKKSCPRVKLNKKHFNNHLTSKLIFLVGNIYSNEMFEIDVARSTNWMELHIWYTGPDEI